MLIRDERYAGKPIEVNFQGNLRDDQAEAIRQTLRHDEGVLCAPTAFGKTVVAAKLIADRAVNTLILVHRQQLLEQWRARLAVFLDLPANAIGQVVGGKDNRTGLIDVALLQSLQRKGEVKDCVAEYGHVIADECHHLTAFSFEQVMRQVKAKFIVGLTATPTRKDGHHPIIFMQCGPIRFNLSAREAAELSPFRHLVLPRHTGFRMPPEVTDLTIHDAYAALVTNEERNQQIVVDVIQAIREGRTPLVLTNRTDHLKRLASGLSEIQHVLILKGGMGKKQRQAAAEIWPRFPTEHHAFCSQPEATSAKVSTIQDSTLCSSRCPSRGAARCSNTSGGCIGFITERKWFEYSTTLTRKFRCLAECTRSG